MKKILIVEDDRFLAKAYQEKLEKEGFEITLAQDGVQAMKLVESFAPNLIILDLIMPIKDGFSVLQDLRSSEKFKKIPVIIASNLGQVEDIDKGKSLGAKDYIVKSDISLDKLVDKINSLTK